MCCRLCGNRLVDGVCKNKYCAAYNNPLIEMVKAGELPFGQVLSSGGLRVCR